MKKVVWGKNPDFFGPRNWFRNSLILSYITRHKSSGKLLDFGCGNGDLLSRISALGFQCVGIDTSPLVIKYLKQRFAKNIGSKSKVVRGDEGFLYKNHGKYDVIVSGETLEHIKDDNKAVRGFYRSLNKGGICVVTVPAHQDRWSELDKYAGRFRRYEKENLIPLFKKEGFLILKVFYWGFPLCYLWDRFIFPPLFYKKLNTYSVSNRSQYFINWLAKQEWIKIITSKIFSFDQLFNFTNLGIGLLLVAKKQ